jgi:hypothetical protein
MPPMTNEQITAAPSRVSPFRTLILFFPALIAMSVALHDLRITLALGAVNLGLVTYFVRLNRGHILIQCLLVLATLIALVGMFSIGSKLH